MTILAAVDGEHEPDSVVEVAYDIGTTYGEPVVVLHVLPSGEFAARQFDQRDYYVEQAEEDAEQLAKRVTRETLGSDGECEFLGKVGDVSRLILDTASELDARYIVVGGRKQTPIGSVLFGSTTQSILLHADRPVVAVFQDLD